MKHLYLISFFLITISVTHAQFTVATHGGTPITDGSVFTYGGVGVPPNSTHVADLSFEITNTSSVQIDMRLEYVSNSNASGTGENLCIFGQCLGEGDPNIGDIFPPAGSNTFTQIDPGETGIYGDHFYNSDPGDGTNVVEYVFKFYELNGNGAPITFTYRYDPAIASSEEFSQINYSLYPNVTFNKFNFINDEPVTINIINMQGQKMMEYNLSIGNHIIDVSNLSSQLYYVRVESKQGKKSITKLIKK